MQQAAAGHTESGFFPFHQHLIVFLKRSQIFNLHAHLLNPVLADNVDEVVGLRACGEEEDILVVNNPILLDRFAHAFPVSWSIFLDFSIIQRLHNILAVISKCLRHIVVENYIRSFMRRQQLLEIGYFAFTGNWHVIDLDIVFITEFLLNPAGVIVIAYIPALESTLIDRNIQTDSFLKPL
ncbi:hypothetical protein D3C73_1223430 [compost metagenome]